MQLEQLFFSMNSMVQHPDRPRISIVSQDRPFPFLIAFLALTLRLMVLDGSRIVQRKNPLYHSSQALRKALDRRRFSLNCKIVLTKFQNQMFILFVYSDR